MEPDAGLLEDFLAAVAAGNLPVIVGLVLLVLLPAVGYVLAGKLSERADGWLSVIRGFVVALASAMIGAAASGGDWRIGLAAGAFGILQSGGLLDKVRELIPGRKGGPS